uniref:Uncharacterized protein n=1 Tax=Arundo donax TaxID=35708 RepID=A0A0A9EHA8_ARUDO
MVTWVTNYTSPSYLMHCVQTIDHSVKCN